MSREGALRVASWLRDGSDPPPPALERAAVAAVEALTTAGLVVRDALLVQTSEGDRDRLRIEFSGPASPERFHVAYVVSTDDVVGVGRVNRAPAWVETRNVGGVALEEVEASAGALPRDRPAANALYRRLARVRHDPRVVALDRAIGGEELFGLPPWRTERSLRVLLDLRELSVGQAEVGFRVVEEVLAGAPVEWALRRARSEGPWRE